MVGVGGAFLVQPAGGSRELQGILGRAPLMPGEDSSTRKWQGKRYGVCVFAREPIKIQELNVSKRLSIEKKGEKKKSPQSSISHTAPPACLSSARAGKFVAVGEHGVAMETDACCPSLLLVLLFLLHLFHPPLPLNFSP